MNEILNQNPAAKAAIESLQPKVVGIANALSKLLDRLARNDALAQAQQAFAADPSDDNAQQLLGVMATRTQNNQAMLDVRDTIPSLRQLMYAAIAADIAAAADAVHQAFVSYLGDVETENAKRSRMATGQFQVDVAEIQKLRSTLDKAELARVSARSGNHESAANSLMALAGI